MGKINYIPDKEINLIGNDLLGTSAYVETIVRIVKYCETPHTVGLFGAWGSGKSSIVKTLKEKLENDKSSKIKVFIYNAWKYSKDDFRRTFILELTRFIYPNDKRKINEIQRKLYKSESTATNVGISTKINFGRTTVIQSTPAIQPELFEEMFKEMLSDKKCEKLVIALDNIDRCHKEEAFEILLTIKNFLEIEGVIFLIPLDDNGLKKFLRMDNEFLRKLFNTTVRIKSFSDVELYDFGMKLLEKYQIDFPRKQNVISMVCQEFSKNPRRIIQFLNTLQTEYQLAKIQEEQGLLPGGAITNNIEMLVKIDIIREEYPEIFARISDNRGLLKEMCEAIRVGEPSKTDDGSYELKKDKSEIIKLTEEQYRFFLRTSNIELNKTDLEPFFLNKDVFKNLPDEIYQQAISGDWKSLKEAVEKKEINFETLISFIDRLANEDVIRRSLYDTSGFNLASLIIKIVTDAKYGNEIEQLPQNVTAMLNRDVIFEQHSYKFPPREFALALKWFYGRGIQVPLKKVIEKLNELTTGDIKKDKTPLQLLKEFIKVFEDEPFRLEEIRHKFSELLIQDFTLYFDFKEIINSEAVKYVLDDKFAGNIISTLQQDYNQNNTKEKVEIIRALNKHEILSAQTKIQYLDLATSFVGQFLGRWDILSFWLEGISEFVTETTEVNSANNLYNALISVSNPIISQFNNKQLADLYIKLYKAYTRILGELYLVVDNSRKQNIATWLNSFFNAQISKDFLLHVNEIYQQIIEKTDNWIFAESFVNQIVHQTDPELRSKLLRTLTLMVRKTNQSSGLNAQQIDKVIAYYFGLLSEGQPEANEGIIEICEKNIFIASKVLEHILNVGDEESVKSTKIIELLISKLGFDQIYREITARLASTSISDQEKGISLLYKVRGKVPPDGIDLIRKLLNMIDMKKLSEDYRKKLKELQGLF